MEVQIAITEKFNHLTLTHHDVSPDMSAASTPTTPCSPTEEYKISIVQNEDAEQAIDFLRRYFFKDEPLNVALNLLEENKTCDALENFSLKSIYEGVSLMTTNEEGEIIAVCINGILNRDDPPEEPAPLSSSKCSKKFEKILNLLDTVDRESDVFGQFPDVNSMMLVKILSVDPSYRGKGLAKTLMDRSRDLCRDKGVPMIRVDCTSHFSAKATKRLGFDCVFCMNYSDYLGEDGKPVFTPEDPHRDVTVYVQRI